jgi:hypothetical protein
MAPAVIHQHLTEEPGFDPGPDRVVFVVDKVAQEQDLLQVFRGYAVSTIPSLLLTRHNESTSLLRSSGRRLGTWQQNISLPAIGELWR